VIPPPDENLEPEGNDTRPYGLALSSRYLKSLGESIKIEEDGEPILKETPRPSESAKQAPKDARIIVAESWLVEYRASKTPKAAAASLRAYRIWHCNEDLNPEAVAKLLRNPPLQTFTVANYILEAIRLDKLPYEATRLQAEVLSLFPKEMLPSRYKLLAGACKQVTGVATVGKA
jgi:hypothetical protein